MTTSTRAGARLRSLDLRALLRLDAALSAVAGLAALAAAPAAADLLDPDVPTTAVRVGGVALLVWALDAALLARTSGRLLRGGAVVAGAGNLAWDLATVVLVARGAFSVTGAVLALAVAAVVGGLGVLQLRAVRRARTSAAPRPSRELAAT